MDHFCVPPSLFSSCRVHSDQWKLPGCRVEYHVPRVLRIWPNPVHLPRTERKSGLYHSLLQEWGEWVWLLLNPPRYAWGYTALTSDLWPRHQHIMVAAGQGISKGRHVSLGHGIALQPLRSSFCHSADSRKTLGKVPRQAWEIPKVDIAAPGVFYRCSMMICIPKARRERWPGSLASKEERGKWKVRARGDRNRLENIRIIWAGPKWHQHPETSERGIYSQNNEM